MKERYQKLSLSPIKREANMQLSQFPRYQKADEVLKLYVNRQIEGYVAKMVEGHRK